MSLVLEFYPGLLVVTCHFLLPRQNLSTSATSKLMKWFFPLVVRLSAQVLPDS